MSWSDSDDDLLLSAVSQTSWKSNTSVKSKRILSSSQSQTSWVSSSFGDFDTFSSKQTTSAVGKATRKRGRESNKEKSSFNDLDSNNPLSSKSSRVVTKDVEGGLWSEKHSPRNTCELAVHKKKIEEVQDWLQHNFDRKNQKQAPILLLTGPTGCGKTACLKVLCNELGSEIQEWINPVSTIYDGSRKTWEDSREFNSVGMTVTESQASLFQDFLLRANKYQTLAILRQEQFYRKVILVEDFPNIFFRDASQFHQVLRYYHQRGHSPLIFIVSDSVAGESNERLLFPKHIQADLNIANISFNPIAQTSLTKVLSRIANSEASKSQNKRKFCVPDKATTDSLASSSNGDIRGAINALQFACLKGTVKTLNSSTVTTKSKVQKGSAKLKGKATANKKSAEKSKKDNTLAAIGGKDTSLFLFRALGKILYCKRDDPSAYTCPTTLPSHLAHHYRDPLLVDPEDVLEKSHLSSEFFTAYLHQNYPEFYSSIDSVVTASDYLSDSDYLTINWANRSVLNPYSASVAARGLMFANTDRATHSGSAGSKLGWKPLHKPQWFDTCRKIRSNISTAKSLFAGHCTPVELQTLLIPYMSVINVRVCDPARANYVREVGRMSRYVRSTVERLDEKDVSMLTADDTYQDQSLVQDTDTKNGGHSESHELGGIPSCSFLAPVTEETSVNRNVNIGADMIGDVTLIEGSVDIDDDVIIDDFDD